MTMSIDESGREFRDPTQDLDKLASRIETHISALLGVDGLPRRDLGLPSLNGEAVASLSTCSLNLDPSCDFHSGQKYLSYLIRPHPISLPSGRAAPEQWKRSAPKHCQRNNRRLAQQQATVSSNVLFVDRLGIDMEPHCTSTTSKDPLRR